jgi:hypothetical protein
VILSWHTVLPAPKAVICSFQLISVIGNEPHCSLAGDYSRPDAEGFTISHSAAQPAGRCRSGFLAMAANRWTARSGLCGVYVSACGADPGPRPTPGRPFVDDARHFRPARKAGRRTRRRRPDPAWRQDQPLPFFPIRVVWCRQSRQER